MSDLFVDSQVTERGRGTAALCPKCGFLGEMKGFNSRTGLYFKFIRLKRINNKKILVCPECNHVFEVPR